MHNLIDYSQKIKSEIPTETNTRTNAGDVLIELRQINKSNIEFYEVLAREISDIKKVCQVDQERLDKVETDLLVHKNQVSTQLAEMQTNVDLLKEENCTLKSENKLMRDDISVLKEKNS